MTNSEIIEDAKKLRGIIKECHTFAHWKELGYQVKRGEHAVFAEFIWKCKASEKPAADGNDKEEKNEMFKTKAFFFSEDQVQPIQ